MVELLFLGLPVIDAYFPPVRLAFAENSRIVGSGMAEKLGVRAPIFTLC